MAALLIVDDDPDLLTILDGHCGARGHKVTVALTCLEGLSAAERQPPDLVLLDFRLPKMDGGRFLEILRADERTKLTPVIIMSTAAPAWISARLDTDRHVKILEKPFDFAVLDRMIEAMIGAQG
jgi:DNA-binding response OmpR family regulator